MIELAASIDIDVPAGLAWEFVADYRRDVDWRRGVERMVPTPLGLVGVGTTTSEDIRVAGRRYHNDGEVASVIAERRFEWHTTSGAQASGARTVEPLGPDRSRVTLELSVEPSGVERVLAPLLRRVLRRTLVSDLARLRTLMQSGGEGYAVSTVRSTDTSVRSG
jgi:hypothetical protein